MPVRERHPARSIVVTCGEINDARAAGALDHHICKASGIDAIRMFVQRLVTYIGSYFTLLGGADAVVFTGGIGENSAQIREQVIQKLGCLGCTLDPEKNNQTLGRPAIISTPDSRLKAIVMPTNEELMIARETVKLLTVPTKAIPTQDSCNPTCDCKRV